MIVSDNGKNVKERTYVLFSNARVDAVRLLIQIGGKDKKN